MKKIFFTLIFACLFWPGLALSNTLAAPPSPTVAPPDAMPTKAGPPENAPLLISSRPIVVFRSANQGISASDRVQRARARIEEQLRRPAPHVVSLETDPAGIQVRINAASSFIVTPNDLDPARDQTLQQLAEQAAAALTIAIKETQESRNIDTLLWAIGKSLLATILFASLLWLANRGRYRLTRRLARITTEHTDKLHVGGMALLHSDRVTRLVHLAATLVYHLFVLLLSVNWLGYVLQTFPFTRAWGESLNSFLIDLAKPLLAGALASIPELLTAALIFYIAFLVIKALDQFFLNIQSGQAELRWLDADIAAPTQRISKVVIWLFALAMAYPYLPGSDTEAFKGLSVLVGLMLSMGASSLVGQAASGLILTYGRAFRKGEFVRVADNEGTVTEMGIFTTRIRTGLGEEITLSNASILNGTTRNYSRAVQGAGFVLDTSVSIGYDTPWRQVHAMLIEAARNTPGVLHSPAPQVFQTALADWYPVYRLVCQAVPEGPAPRAIILSNLHANIQDIFNQHGVAIMSPHYMTDPAEPKVVAPSQWYRAPAVAPEATSKAAQASPQSARDDHLPAP